MSPHTPSGPAEEHLRQVDDQIEQLGHAMLALADRVAQLAAQVEDLTGTDGATVSRRTPAPWLWFSAPLAAEDTGDPPDLRTTLDTFVAWYNITYVGVEGSPARRIPDCWRQHPGLAMEIGTLAYTWRTANLGRSATARDAQTWHHQWRPGFTTRLAREWVHPDCLDGTHRPTGAPERPDRHTLDNHNTPPPHDAGGAPSGSY